jgi:hypothetical protein
MFMTYSEGRIQKQRALGNVENQKLHTTKYSDGQHRPATTDSIAQVFIPRESPGSGARA